MLCLTHLELPCSDKFTLGSPPPLKGPKMWLHLWCHQSIQGSRNSYFLAISSRRPFNTWYIATVVASHSFLHICLNVAWSSTIILLLLWFTEFLKWNWHPHTLSAQNFPINLDGIVICPPFITHKTSRIEHVIFFSSNFSQNFIQEHKESWDIIHVFTLHFHTDQSDHLMHCGMVCP